MVTEEQIKELAFAIWEKEGRPEGKHVEHYFRAKQILEERGAERVTEIAPKAPAIELTPQTTPIELASPQDRKKTIPSRKKR